MSRERISAEAVALWRQVFGQAPPLREDGSLMLQLILESLPPLGYDRFTNNGLANLEAFSLNGGPDPAAKSPGR